MVVCYLPAFAPRIHIPLRSCTVFYVYRLLLYMHQEYRGLSHVSSTWFVFVAWLYLPREMLSQPLFKETTQLHSPPHSASCSPLEEDHSKPTGVVLSEVLLVIPQHLLSLHRTEHLLLSFMDLRSPEEQGFCPPCDCTWDAVLADAVSGCVPALSVCALWGEAVMSEPQREWFLRVAVA